MQTSAPVTIPVGTLAPPMITFNVTPSTIAYGDKLPLNAMATASTCGMPVSIAYAASEGSIAGNTFDSTGVSFDLNNRLKQQSKTVTLTATATDSKNQMASATAPVTVTLVPEARRLDDIVFQPRSSRVNNCGKRLLIDVLTPMLRNDPDSKVILIGHRAMNEPAASMVDMQRTLNAAAVLSAGMGICPSLDLSRVLVKWVGDDQASMTRPALCGTSTDVKERRGQAVSESDTQAQYRRVEIWFVPGGAAMPADITGLMPAPEKEVKAKGCPR
jgi:outer membrane protein OmpA-like peptidoglycan-associated protein